MASADAVQIAWLHPGSSEAGPFSLPGRVGACASASHAKFPSDVLSYSFMKLRSPSNRKSGLSVSESNVKRYAILTINDPHNYGNRLQNYAMQEMLREYGFVTTIRFLTPDVTGIAKFKRGLKGIGKKALGPLIRTLPIGNKSLLAKRYGKDIEFTRKYVPDDVLSLTLSDGLKGVDRFYPSKIVIGSDQVWNYIWVSPQELRYRIGIFRRGMPAIAYAASIGVSEIPDQIKPVFVEGLQGLQSVSVREDRTKELVDGLSDREVSVVLDPTLMVDRRRWESIFGGFVPDDDQYVLTYFLSKQSAEVENFINDYACRNGLRIRRILDFRDPETYVAGPQDFVELIAKSAFVFTDSYHACCFSILFEKQFKVFSRTEYDGKMSLNSRMDTLFREFDLSDVMSERYGLGTIDYDRVDEMLDRNRQSSHEWLRTALE